MLTAVLAATAQVRGAGLACKAARSSDAPRLREKDSSCKGGGGGGKAASGARCICRGGWRCCCYPALVAGQASARRAQAPAHAGRICICMCTHTHTHTSEMRARRPPLYITDISSVLILFFSFAACARRPPRPCPHSVEAASAALLPHVPLPAVHSSGHRQPLALPYAARIHRRCDRDLPPQILFCGGC
jgi:hypothetical protein